MLLKRHKTAAATPSYCTLHLVMDVNYTIFDDMRRLGIGSNDVTDPGPKDSSGGNLNPKYDIIPVMNPYLISYKILVISK